MGITLEERKSSGYSAVKITDIDSADDITLISDYLKKKVQRLVEQEESAARQDGLQINSTKTEFMKYNHL